MENGNEWGDRIQRELPVRRISLVGFPGGTSGKEPICQCRRGSGLIPGWGRSPGEGMATHSSILAWRIPWTEEPGWLQSMGTVVEVGMQS